MPPADDLQRTEVVRPLGRARGERVAPHVVGLLRRVEERQPAVGVLRGALDVLLAERRDVDRDARPLRLGQHLQRLAEAGALALGQRQVEDLAVVLQALAPQRHPDDVDDLAGAAQRLVVGQPVPALDDLRAGGAEPEDRAAAADVVEPGRGLGERARACASRR